MKLRLNRKNTIGLIFFLAFVISTSLIFQFEERFTTENWKSNHTTRYKMVDDLIESQLLIGKTSEEVIEILGHPSTTRYKKSELFVYNIGKEPSFFEAQPDRLVVIFVNNKVDLVSLAVE